MKLIHISDLHLGFRQYQRQTTTGLNQREADVAAAFRKTIDAVIELRPDVIVIAGDVFHAVRPTNPAILAAYTHFTRLVQMLPDTVIVMVAGNHDTPRTTETGCLLRLFSSLGIRVVDTDPKSIRFPDHDLHVFAVPDGVRPRPRFEPDPSVRYNVLLMHDEVEGVINRFGSLVERPVTDLPLSELRADQWDYVALGHYHVYHEVAPNAFYSGSI